jgi:death-on-curing protein
VRGEPLWLSVAVVLAIHDRLIAEFGGESGVRDPALLESALASARNYFAHGADDLFDLAEAYASALSRDHPFIDGNKRVALTVAIVFLETNGTRFMADEEEAVRFSYALASRSLEKGGFADWLRKSCTIRRGPPKRRVGHSGARRIRSRGARKGKR